MRRARKRELLLGLGGENGVDLYAGSGEYGVVGSGFCALSAKSEEFNQILHVSIDKIDLAHFS